MCCPPSNALSALIQEGQEPPQAVKETIDRVGLARWYPVAGGHRILVPHRGEAFDAAHFRVEEGAWDHEHCAVCEETVPATTRCWVTETGPFIILCLKCKERMNE